MTRSWRSPTEPRPQGVNKERLIPLNLSSEHADEADNRAPWSEVSSLTVFWEETSHRLC